MGGEDHPGQTAAQRQAGPGSAEALCCVYWCREAAVIVVELEDGRYGCCRKHAVFIKAGRIDWFERSGSPKS